MVSRGSWTSCVSTLKVGLGISAAVLCTGAALAQEKLAAQPASIAGLTKNPQAAAMLPDARKGAPITSAVFSNMPFTLIDNAGAFYGVGVELSEAIANVLGVKLSVSQVKDVPSSKLGVESGRFDMTSGPILNIAGAQKNTFLIPYVQTLTGFLHPANAKYSDAMQFCGKRLAIVAGSLATEGVTKVLAQTCKTKGLPEPTVTGLGGQEATIVGVDSNRQDAAVMSAATALYAASQKPDRYGAYALKDDIFGIGLWSGFLIQKSDKSVADAVLAALKVLQNNGVYAEIMKRYGLESAMVKEFAINPPPPTN